MILEKTAMELNHKMYTGFLGGEGGLTTVNHISFFIKIKMSPLASYMDIFPKIFKLMDILLTLRHSVHQQ